MKRSSSLREIIKEYLLDRAGVQILSGFRDNSCSYIRDFLVVIPTNQYLGDLKELGELFTFGSFIQNGENKIGLT
jgi:hypothetical protein